MQANSQIRQMDLFALRVYWCLIPIFLLLAPVVYFQLIVMSWGQMALLAGASAGFAGVATIAYRLGISGRPFCYLIGFAMSVDIMLVWFVLDYGVALWPIWLLPVLVTIVYGNWRTTGGTSLLAIVLCGASIWFHHPGEVHARLRDMSDVYATFVFLLLMLCAISYQAGRLLQANEKAAAKQKAISEDLKQVLAQAATTADMLMHSATGLESGSRTAQSSIDGDCRQVAQQLDEGWTEQVAALHQVTDTLRQHAQAIGQIAAGAEEQAREATKAFAATQEMAASVSSAAQYAEAANHVSQQASRQADAGWNAVQETLGSLSALGTAVQDASVTVSELGGLSAQIGQIVETITVIADQTDMLALNAAIEAARAGEHGRGFAVVADEVRKLAERSSRASQEIGTLIERIQGRIERTVAAMEEAAGTAQRGARLSVEAREALAGIQSAARQTAEQVQSIAQQVQTVAHSSRSVEQAVGQMAAVSQESTAATEEMAAGSGQIGTALTHVEDLALRGTEDLRRFRASLDQVAAVVRDTAEASRSLTAQAVGLQGAVKAEHLDVAR